METVRKLRDISCRTFSRHPVNISRVEELVQFVVSNFRRQQRVDTIAQMATTIRTNSLAMKGKSHEEAVRDAVDIYRIVEEIA